MDEIRAAAQREESIRISERKSSISLLFWIIAINTASVDNTEGDVRPKTLRKCPDVAHD